MATDSNPRSGSPSTPVYTGRGVDRRLPAVRIGLTGGLVGMVCCVGPTVLALVGMVGAGTAYVWAENLYGGYAWWFRLAGLVVTVGLVVWALRRRRACTVAGAKAARWRLLLVLGVAVVTYGLLYGLTTWAGTLAT